MAAFVVLAIALIGAASMLAYGLDWFFDVEAML
jgi:hypothetical protein